MSSEQEPLLGIHVLGGIQGESIVINLPGDRWGVVDCYTSRLDAPDLNPTVRFLRDNGVSKLDFLCLTHPHDDHYRGMAHILDAFPVECFWQFPVLPHPVMRRLIDHDIWDAEESQDRDRQETAQELVRLFGRVNALGKSQKIRRELLNIGQQMYDRDGVRVIAVAPSGDQTLRYVERLTNCFNSDGTVKGRLPNSAHNMISAALIIEFGTSRILLGGDVETSGWQDSLAHFGDNLAIHAAKVSHHGSTNGYCEGLWPTLSRKGKPISVIAPFRRFGLPKRVALEHIAAHSERVLTTSMVGIRESVLPIPLFPSAPPRSREYLRNEFKASAISGDDATGICSLYFDRSGTCVKTDLVPPAAAISF